jgi:uncharacterized protein YdaU (DUF1376 family)
MDDIRNSNSNGKLSWFAFHPADFAGETQGLTQGEVGAYILLASYYARMGNLPTDDVRLARIARCKNVNEWRAMRRSIDPLLSPNSRLTTELRIAHAKRERRVDAGRKGGLAKSSNAKAKPYQPEPEPEEVRGYREEAPSSKGRANSLEGSATVKEEASTREDGLTPANGKGWVH